MFPRAPGSSGERLRPIVAKARQSLRGMRPRRLARPETTPRCRTGSSSRSATSPGTSSRVGTCCASRSGSVRHCTMCDHCRRHSAKRGALRGSSSKLCANSSELAARGRPAGQRLDHRALVERPVRRSRDRPGRSRARRRRRPGRRRRGAPSWNSLARGDLAQLCLHSSRSPVRRSSLRHQPASSQSSSRPRASALRRPSAADVQPAARRRSARMQRRIAAAGAERLAVEEDMARRRTACGSAGRGRRLPATRAPARRARTRCRAWARSSASPSARCARPGVGRGARTTAVGEALQRAGMRAGAAVAGWARSA